MSRTSIIYIGLSRTMLLIDLARGSAVGWGVALQKVAGFDSRWCQWHIPSCRTMVLGSTQPLILINTRNVSWGVKAAGA